MVFGNGTSLLLHNDAVTNSGIIEVFPNAALTFDQGSAVDNDAGTITVADTGTLNLDTATIEIRTASARRSAPAR